MKIPISVEDLAERIYTAASQAGFTKEVFTWITDPVAYTQLAILASTTDELDRYEFGPDESEPAISLVIQRFRADGDEDTEIFYDELRQQLGENMNSIQKLTESPMDFGDTPDMVPPPTKQSIAGFKNAAVPPGHFEKAASKAYKDAYEKLRRYTGQQPRRPQDMQRIGMAMMGALQKVQQIEKGHEADLEQAAIELVLSLPEFSAAKEAYDSGDLGIEVKLTSKVNLDGAREEAEDLTPEEEKGIAQAAEEIDTEVQKRRFINMMIQGSSQGKIYAFHMAQEVLDKIDPRLVPLYGTLSSAGHFFYWLVPDPRVGPGGGGGKGDPAGSARIKLVDGTPTIEAQGVTFPMLVHELSKGLMEFLSYPEDEDDDNRKRIFAKADTLDQEPNDLRVGPAIWEQIVAHIGPANAKIMPHVYDKIVRLPASEFNGLMKGLLADDSAAKSKLDKIIADVKRQQESMDSSISSLTD